MACVRVASVTFCLLPVMLLSGACGCETRASYALPSTHWGVVRASRSWVVRPSPRCVRCVVTLFSSACGHDAVSWQHSYGYTVTLITRNGCCRPPGPFWRKLARQRHRAAPKVCVCVCPVRCLLRVNGMLCALVVGGCLLGGRSVSGMFWFRTNYV